MLVAAWLIYDNLNIIKFWWAKRNARRKHKETGKRYYVVPGKDKLYVLSTRQINALNRKLPKPKRVNILRLLIDSYYHTK